MLLQSVQVEGKGPLAMKDLQVGDNIKTSIGESYEPVFAFGHFSPKTEAEFVQLVTEKSTLEMSGEHLVFVAGKTNPVRADSFQVGDMLHPAAKVTQIGTVHREGLYDPLTESGTIIVDGILASNYVSLQKEAEFMAVDNVTTSMSQHNFVHLMLSPFRILCLGISSSMCDKYNVEGMPEFIAKAMEFQLWAESQNVLCQWVMLAAVIVCASVCMILEKTFGAAMGPTIVAAIGAVYGLFKATGLSVHASKNKTA